MHLFKLDAVKRGMRADKPSCLLAEHCDLESGSSQLLPYQAPFAREEVLNTSIHFREHLAQSYLKQLYLLILCRMIA